MLERIIETGAIFFARSDDPWVLSGANVHISFVGQDNGNEPDRELDGQEVASINANLTAGLDLTQARRLAENSAVAFIADVKAGPFDIGPELAAEMLAHPNPDGRSNRDVIRPWVNAQDITGRSREMWIIDFGLDMSEAEAALYEAPFEYVKQHVQPLRVKVRRPRYRDRWWLHAEAIPGMRKAMPLLHRYIATPETAKHRVFVWLETDILADHALVVFVRDDDFTFGILHSRTHELWARGTGTQLREVESGFRYTPTTCFETFPFPDATEEQRVQISHYAQLLVTLRDGWVNPEGVSPADLAKRTLTSLYNQRPTWLADAHRDLDTAVLGAYALPADASDDQILVHLLDLNLSRAAARNGVAPEGVAE